MAGRWQAELHDSGPDAVQGQGGAGYTGLKMLTTWAAYAEVWCSDACLQLACMLDQARHASLLACNMVRFASSFMAGRFKRQASSARLDSWRSGFRGARVFRRLEPTTVSSRSRDSRDQIEICC